MVEQALTNIEMYKPYDDVLAVCRKQLQSGYLIATSRIHITIYWTWMLGNIVSPL